MRRAARRRARRALARRRGGRSRRAGQAPPTPARPGPRPLPPPLRIPAPAATPASASSRTPAVVIGSTVTAAQLLQRPLARQIEPAQRRDLVAPPLRPRRRGHPEAVHVHDPAAHAELRHLGHRRHAAIPHPLERRHDVAQRLSRAHREPKRQLIERRRAPACAPPSRARWSPESAAVRAAAPRSSPPARRRSRSAARLRPSASRCG